MSITIKMGQLTIEDNNGKYIVIDILSEIIAQKISMATALKFNKIIKQINIHINEFNEQKIKLIKENGEEVKNEKGEPTGYQTLPDKIDFVREELTKATEIDIVLEGDKFNPDDFKDVKIETHKMMVISWLFD